MMLILFSEGNFQTLVIKKVLSHLKMHFNLNDYRYENIKYHIVIAEVWTILNQKCFGRFRLFSMNIEVGVGLKWGNWNLSHGFTTSCFIIGESLFSKLNPNFFLCKSGDTIKDILAAFFKKSGCINPGDQLLYIGFS